MSTTNTLRIARIVLNVSDLPSLCAFYQDALGFSLVDRTERAATLRLGDQQINLVHQPQGKAYPADPAGNDPWFQHFAIVVSDMDMAYAQLARYPHQPISKGGPQLLPPSTGAVTAYKFRDPEGHPLELTHLPHSVWNDRVLQGGAPFLGIDHSGLVVLDLGSAIAFYTEVLGFERVTTGINRGPEQDRLDGLDGVELDIAVLRTHAAGPHIELLHYRSPQPPPRMDIDVDDVAATRLCLTGLHPSTLDEAIAARAKSPVSNYKGALIQDPDGHWLEMDFGDTPK